MARTGGTDMFFRGEVRDNVVSGINDRSLGVLNKKTEYTEGNE